MRLAVLALFIILVGPAVQALEVTSLQVSAVPGGGEHVTLQLSSRIDAKVFTVDNPPPRVVIDIPTARWRGKVGLPRGYSGDYIKRVRFAFHDESTNRIVFELAQNVKLRNVTKGSQGDAYSLEFDLVGPGSSSSSIFSSAPKEKPQTKPMIIIDAGHGGQDPGTSGRGGTLEKRVTLEYATALKEALLKTGQYRVTLTRDDDRYLFLRDRVKRARAAKGDLFISLHADSAPTQSARGLSVYTISEKASDKESEALAAKENKADVIGGMDLSSASKDVADILIDLAGRETRAKSAQFADIAIRSLGREVHLLSNSHRFAGFAVLKAPDIPSVLVEVGFLTSPREEHLLKSSAYETKVVRGLTKAIDSYFHKNKK